jgi:ParB/RepB/Spo0J family partition protein
MVKELAVDRIRSGGAEIDPFDLEQLVKSIAEHGLLQPVVVSKLPDGDNYEIIAGHMRFEACKKLKWSSVPVLVRKNKTEALCRIS